MPFLEFNSFKKKRLTTYVGVGVSYFTNEFDFETNFFNRAVSTDLTWSFSCLLYTSPSPRDQRGSRMPSSA